MKPTLEQLNQMSDRELDIQVHNILDQCYHDWEHPDLLRNVHHCLECGIVRGYQPQDQYSTDPSLIFKLIKFAASKGFFFDILGDVGKVEFYNEEYFGVAYETIDELPKAIVKSFILAMSNLLESD